MSLIKSKKDFWIFFGSSITALLIVNLYGLGQKFMNFPAIQTMNAEFAKGMLLTLTPEARISSTFGGHYDLAAYLIFSMPILLGLYFKTQKKFFFILFLLSLSSLFYTASRISFLAYIISTSMFLIFLRKYFIYLFILSITLNLSFLTGDLTKRFVKTFQVKQILVNDKTGQVYIPQKITSKELPAGSAYVKLNNQQNASKETQTYKDKVIADKILAQKGTSQTNSNSKDKKLTDKEKTKEAEKTASREASLSASLSEDIKPINTIVADISFATRLQIEWPRAIDALKKNPLLGTGPSSITEATDNDYLRWLGELGLLGTLTFMYILFSIIIIIWKKTREADKANKYFYYGIIFGIFALLINATYIDVFEASKVAFNFWLLIGIIIGYLQLNEELQSNT